MAMEYDEGPICKHPLELDSLPGYSLAIRSKYSMNACLPSPTCGLCCRYSRPANRSIASAGRL